MRMRINYLAPLLHVDAPWLPACPLHPTEKLNTEARLAPGLPSNPPHPLHLMQGAVQRGGRGPADRRLLLDPLPGRPHHRERERPPPPPPLYPPGPPPCALHRAESSSIFLGALLRPKRHVPTPMRSLGHAVRVQGGLGWLVPQNGAPPLGWAATGAYLVLPILLVVSQVGVKQA